jgi:fermentation-respiration switch protein FrsA (DUF1100 family)
MTFLLAIAIAALLFLTSVTIILLLIGPTLLLRPRRRTAEYYRSIGMPVSPSDLLLSFESFTVVSENDITLDCWFIPAQAPVRGTILYLHGVGDCKIDGLRAAKLFNDNRYNVLLYDARRHGTSGGNFCTYGFYEKFDVLRVIDFLAKRDNLTLEKIGIFGTSMGAAVALQAAALDRRITGVVAENSFATLRSIFDDYQRRMIKLPFHYLRNIVIVRSEFLARFKASEVSPVSAIKNVHVPVFIVYGENDHLINCKYSIQLYAAANKPKEIYPIPGASHNDTWLIGGKEYEEKVLRFFEESLQ